MSIGLMFHDGIIHRGTVGRAKQEITALYVYEVQGKAEKCFPGLLRFPIVGKETSLIFSKATVIF